MASTAGLCEGASGAEGGSGARRKRVGLTALGTLLRAVPLRVRFRAEPRGESACEFRWFHGGGAIRTCGDG